MEIYPIGKTKNTETLIKKISHILNTKEKIEFPFDYSEVSDESEYNYPADRIGGFAQIKNKLNIPNEIYVNKNNLKEIGAFVLDLLTN
jgi:hypothetical protein